MTERSRTFLKQEFDDGERPSGIDFGDLVDSSLNKVDDGVQVDSSGTVVVTGGLGLGDSARAVAGTLRFNAGRLQFHDGTDFVDLSGGGGGGAFESVGAGGEVAYAGGNVGVGDFTAVPPTFRLEVELGDNVDEDDRVRFGNAVCSNGAGALQTDACFYHRNHSAAEGMALRQRASGEVRVNAPSGQSIRLVHDSNQTRLAVAGTGEVLVGASTPQGAFAFQVIGDACKTGGGNVWKTCSDARLKEDVRDLEVGLEQLLQVRPVRFRFNGKGTTRRGEEGVGILGQEIEEIFPEMVTRVPMAIEEGGEPVDVRVYDGSALTYVLVNAVKELSAKVARLEAAAANG